jgi:hypothetical protein
MKRISKISIFGFVVWLAACQTVVDIDVPFDPRKLVVNALISTDSLMQVRVNRSLNVLEQPGRSDNFISNAQVEIEEVGQNQSEDLFHKEEGWYEGEMMRPEAGKTYRLRVSAPNFDPIEATTFVPEKVPILNFTIDEEKVRLDQGSTEALRMRLTFKDPGENRNYYLVRYFQYYPQYDYSTPFPYELIGYYRERIYVRVEDPTVTMLNGAEIIFTDEFISGQTFELITFMYDYCFFGNCGNENDDGRKIEIELHTISRDYYLFLTSLNLQSNAQGDPFAEPVPVFNNIENGFGIFAGYSSDLIEFIIKNPQ